MRVLGIESTCDETAASVVVSGQTILSQIISSQADIHQKYGGVFPEVASRQHAEMVAPVIAQALAEAHLTIEEIDLIAVAHGPGLIGALLVGLQMAKGLAWALKKPIVGVNHVEAHLYAAIMSHDREVVFPCLGVVLSGGHTFLLRVYEVGRYEILARTIDDAIGEAFDKVAKMVGLPYPGGPPVERLARQGDPYRFALRAGRCQNPLDFSFSGLKTAVLHTLKDHSVDAIRADVCASFQRAALQDVWQKTVKAAEQIGTNRVLFGGGVTNNSALREIFSEQSPFLHCLWPTPLLSLDNASMIAGLGYHVYRLHGPDDLFSLEAKARIW